MSEGTAVNVGIDVSKDRLDCSTTHGECKSVANDDTGIREVLTWLPSMKVERVVAEASGG